MIESDDVVKGFIFVVLADFLDVGEVWLDEAEVGAAEPAPAEAGGGRKSRVAPAPSISSLVFSGLWNAALSIVTT